VEAPFFFPEVAIAHWFFKRKYGNCDNVRNWTPSPGTKMQEKWWEERKRFGEKSSCWKKLSAKSTCDLAYWRVEQTNLNVFDKLNKEMGIFEIRLLQTGTEHRSAFVIPVSYLI